MITGMKEESVETQGKPEVVVITGGSAGLGRATAIAFARQGACVALLARGRDGLAAACRDVEEHGGRALAAPNDVADHEGVERAPETVERELGPIDVWINSVMVTVLLPMEELPQYN